MQPFVYTSVVIPYKEVKGTVSLSVNTKSFVLPISLINSNFLNENLENFLPYICSKDYPAALTAWKFLFSYSAIRMQRLCITYILTQQLPTTIGRAATISSKVVTPPSIPLLLATETTVCLFRLPSGADNAITGSHMLSSQFINKRRLHKHYETGANNSWHGVCTKINSSQDSGVK